MFSPDKKEEKAVIYSIRWAYWNNRFLKKKIIDDEVK